MEGVMMRTPHSYCVAVRRPDGSLATDERNIARVSEKYPIFRFPLLRGLGTLGQAMSLGIKALKFSANAALEAETSQDPKKDSKESEKSGAISGWVMGLNLAFSLAFFIFLYKFVPLWVTTKIGEAVPQVQGRIAFNLVDGVIRIGIFLAFMYII